MTESLYEIIRQCDASQHRSDVRRGKVEHRKDMRLFAVLVITGAVLLVVAAITMAEVR